MIKSNPRRRARVAVGMRPSTKSMPTSPSAITRSVGTHSRDGICRCRAHPMTRGAFRGSRSSGSSVDRGMLDRLQGRAGRDEKFRRAVSRVWRSQWVSWSPP
jgi:hypothetical protein